MASPKRIWSIDATFDRGLREMLDLSPDAIFMKDGQGRWLWTNKAGLEMFGLNKIAYALKTDQELADELGKTSFFYRNIFSNCRNTDENAWAREMLWRNEERVDMPGLGSQFFEVIKSPFFASNGERKGLLGIRRNITAQKQAHSKIHFLANYDSLTGLPNRTLFHARFEQSLRQAQENGQILAIISIDLDHFKHINDTAGHAMGDLLLKSIAERLLMQIHPTDILARMGADEFALVLTQIGHADEVHVFVENLLKTLNMSFLLNDQEVHTGVSLGIAFYPADDKDPEALIKNADLAMSEAKRLGRNTFHYYTADLSTRNRTRIHLAKELRHALARQELSLAYQPQQDLRTGRMIGVEALLRWHHPQRGAIPPAEFIPIAEESGLIVAIGEWVLHHACAQNKAWQDQGLPPIRMAVNISARQCSFPSQPFIQTVTQALRHSGLAPHYLELELTESVLMHQPERTAQALHELKDYGLRFAIDDFGTGYSSLSYLKRFPIHTLKIDQSFVQEINSNPSDAAIVKAVIQLGHNLGIQVMAEGVETREQLEFLKAEQCDAMQGYHMSTPIDAQECARVLARFSS